MLNSEQSGHMNELSGIPKAAKCACGWFLKGECPNHDCPNSESDAIVYLLGNDVYRWDPRINKKHVLVGSGLKREAAMAIVKLQTMNGDCRYVE